MATNILGLLAQLPANYTWHEAQSQIGNPSNAEATAQLRAAGISETHISAFLGGRETASQVLNQITKYQRPSPLEAAGLLAAGGIAAKGAGLGASNLLGSGSLTDQLGKYGAAAAFIPLVAWLTTGKNWVRVLEYVGGAVMIGIAMRELAKQ